MSTTDKWPEHVCKTGAEFAAFAKAGRRLGDLHCGYESAKPWKGCVVDVKGGAMTGGAGETGVSGGTGGGGQA